MNELRSDDNVSSMNHGAAQTLVQSFDDTGQLRNDMIRKFAEDGKFDEIAAALARICNVSVELVEQAMIQGQSETIIIFAKAAKLSWATAKALLSFSVRQRRVSSDEIERCLASFERLNFGTAQQIMEFYRKRATRGSSRPI